MKSKFRSNVKDKSIGAGHFNIQVSSLVHHTNTKPSESYTPKQTFLTAPEHFIQHTDPSHRDIEDGAVNKSRLNKSQFYSDYDKLKLQSKNNRGSGKGANTYM